MALSVNNMLGGGGSMKIENAVEMTYAVLEGSSVRKNTFVSKTTKPFDVETWKPSFYASSNDVIIYKDEDAIFTAFQPQNGYYTLAVLSNKYGLVRDICTANVNNILITTKVFKLSTDRYAVFYCTTAALSYDRVAVVSISSSGVSVSSSLVIPASGSVFKIDDTHLGFLTAENTCKTSIYGDGSYDFNLIATPIMVNSDNTLTLGTETKIFSNSGTFVTSGSSSTTVPPTIFSEVLSVGNGSLAFTVEMITSVKDGGLRDSATFSYSLMLAALKLNGNTFTSSIYTIQTSSGNYFSTSYSWADKVDVFSPRSEHFVFKLSSTVFNQVFKAFSIIGSNTITNITYSYNSSYYGSPMTFFKIDDTYHIYMISSTITMLMKWNGSGYTFVTGNTALSSGELLQVASNVFVSAQAKANYQQMVIDVSSETITVTTYQIYPGDTSRSNSSSRFAVLGERYALYYCTYGAPYSVRIVDLYTRTYATYTPNTNINSQPLLYVKIGDYVVISLDVSGDEFLRTILVNLTNMSIVETVENSSPSGYVENISYRIGSAYYGDLGYCYKWYNGTMYITKYELRNSRLRIPGYRVKEYDSSNVIGVSAQSGSDGNSIKVLEAR